MKRFSWACLALASALTAAWTMPTSARPRYGGALRLEVQAAIRSLDPADAVATGGDAARARLASLVFETLVRLDEAGRFQPGLAVSWRQDAQGRRWEFQLRSSVRTHDGGTLTATAAAAALQRMNPAWTITATGASLQIDLADGTPDLLWELADARCAIVLGEGAATFGTGPFRLDRWEPGRHAGLRAHDDYWGGRPYLDAVHVEMGRRLADQLNDLEVGRADIVSVQPQDVRRLEQRGLRAAATVPNELVALVVSEPRSVPAGRDGRRALAMSIDRASLAALLQRRGETTAALLPQWLSGHAFLFTAGENRAAARALAQTLPAAARAWRVQVDGTDTVLQALAGRLALDAREAGLSVSIVAAGLPGPAPDARLVRRLAPAGRTERALRQLISDFRIQPPPAIDPGVPAAGPESAWRLESSLVAQHLVLPLVHLPELFGVGSKVSGWDGPRLCPPGSWSLEHAWLRGDRE
jgi:MarR-like DNA-binding transcriptional regulator SgrR of sgrS sRNA